MPTMNYLDRIKQAETRFQAADLVRAFGCQIAAGAYSYSSEQRVSIVEQYNRQAETLERNFSHDHDGYPIEEDNHPWRRWLREWGFL